MMDYDITKKDLDTEANAISETFDVKEKKPRLKTYFLDLIPEDITLIGSGTFIYSARAKSKDGNEIEVIVKLKEESK